MLPEIPAKAFQVAVTALSLTAEEAALIDPVALLVIYHLAGTAFPGGGGAVGWLTRPNTAAVFGGEPPINLVLRGGTQPVMDYLRAAETLW